METTEILHKCRICMEENFPFQEIFKFSFRIEEVPEKISLIETLRKYFELPLEDKAGFSTKICSICLNKTVNFTQFKENSKKIAEELERKQNQILAFDIKTECLESEFSIEDDMLHLEVKLEPEEILKKEEKDASGPEMEYEEDYYCQYCNKKMESYKNYQNHKYKCKKRLDSQGNRVKCKYCKETYATKGSLVKHLEKCKYKAGNKIKAERLTNTESVVCEFCTVQFQTQTKAQRSTYSRHKYRCRLRTSRYKGRVFVCDYCNKKLETADKLERHFLCCSSMRFANSKDGKKATDDIYDEIMVTECEYCKLKFPTQNRELQRIFIVHKSGCKKKHCPELYPYKCKFCTTHLQTTATLEIHESKCLMNTENKRMDCPKCGNVYKLYSSLKKHVKICCPDVRLEEEDQNAYKKCNFCKRTFIKQVAHLYKNHEDMHKSFHFLLDQNSFKFNECGRCLKIYANLEKLNDHLCEPVPKDGCGLFKCTECDQQYEHYRTLKEHFVFFHMKSFICPINECVTEKPTYNLFYYHLQKSHAGFITCITSFPCEYCQTDFPSYYLLERHRKNAGSCTAKTFLCDHCGNAYGKKRDLAAHLLSNMRRFICNYCGKACRDTNSLNMHIKSHTQDKPFMCTTCGKCFSTKVHFAIHCRTHASVRRYECAFCDHKSTTVPLLKKHEKLHTERLQCPVCLNMLSTRFAVSNHLKAVHQISDPNDLQKLMQSVKKCLIKPESLRRKRSYRLTDVH